MSIEDTTRLDELKKALSNLDVAAKDSTQKSYSIDHSFDKLDWASLTTVDLGGITLSPIPSLTTAQIQTLAPNTATQVYSISVGAGGSGGSGGSGQFVQGTANPTISTGTGYVYSQPLTNPSTKIDLKGPDADININGQSLTKMLASIEERLAILKPNLELEAEWNELRDLGDRYRALEQHIIEKNRTFNIMKSMPKPEQTF